MTCALLPLSAALAAKKVSAVELATLFLDRIDRLNPGLNAFIALDRDKTLAQAKARAGEARGVSRQALAGLLPTLGVGGSYVRNNEGFSLDLQKPFGQLATVLSTALHTPFSFSDLPGKATIQPLEAFTGQATLRLPLFAANGYRCGQFPVSETCAETFLSLPMYPELQDHQIETVARELRTILNS